MKLFLSVLSGLAIVVATSTAQAQIDWAAGAPGGTSGGSIEVGGVAGIVLDTGIPATAIGGDRTVAGDYTISAWINSSEDSGTGEAGNDRWWFGTGNQGIHLGILDNAATGTPSTLRHGHWGSDNSGTSSVLVNTWVHATYTFDADGGTLGTGEVSIYLGGQLEATFDTLAPNNSTTNLMIGARNGGELPWIGFIDDVAIFDTVLSAGDVFTLAGDASQAVSLGAVAYYDFEDDQTGTTAAVAGSLGSALTGIAAPLPQVADWAAGAPGGTPGGAVSFDGGSFLGTGIAADLVGGNRGTGGLDYSISAWIYSTDVNPDPDGVPGVPGEALNNRWWLGTGNQGLHLGVFNDPDTGTASTLRNGHWGSDNSGTSTVPSNTWVHATYVFDADGGSLGTGSITIYLDGQSQGTLDTIAPNRSDTDLILGSRSGGRVNEGWVGMVDDLAVFTTALSAGDVATLASDTTQAVALGAGAYFDFEDDQTGTTAANAGTLGFAAIDQIGPAMTGLKGDVDMNGVVDFFDIQPFIDVLANSMFQVEADCDCDGDVDFFDIQPFINILAGLP